MELGVELERSTAQLEGVYVHFYKDSILMSNISELYRVGLSLAPRSRGS